MFRGGIAGWVPLAAIGPFVLYEVGVLFVLRWRTARDKDFPRYGRFANALIETSLPSVIIFVLSHHMDAVDGAGLLAADALFRVHPAVDACGSISGCRCGPAPSRPCS